jgi:hypothetical protein
LRLPAGSHEEATLAKLDAFAAANVPESARGPLAKTKAAIALTIRLRRDTASVLDAYLKAKCREAAAGIVCKP